MNFRDVKINPSWTDMAYIQQVMTQHGTRDSQPKITVLEPNPGLTKQGYLRQNYVQRHRRRNTEFYPIMIIAIRMAYSQKRKIPFWGYVYIIKGKNFIAAPL